MKISVIAFLIFFSLNAYSQYWQTLGSGMDNPVYTVSMTPTWGANTYVFAGGAFTHAGGDPAHFIAQWLNGSWHNAGAAQMAR
jgi:hypothetical protein